MTTTASLVCVAQTSPAPRIIEEKSGNVTNLRVEGELAATRNLDCIDIEQVQRVFTPPDMHTGIRKCFQEGNYDRAARLYLMAGIYARFDAERVTDISARDAGQMLGYRMGQSLTPEQRSEFAKAVAPFTKETPERTALCARIVKVGPPDYTPTYMILHGTEYTARRLNNLPEAANGGLVPAFDADATWSRVQTSYLHCA